MTGLAFTLVGGFGILAAFAVFYYFGGYWRKLWRQKRLALTSPRPSSLVNTTEKP